MSKAARDQTVSHRRHRRRLPAHNRTQGFRSSGAERPQTNASVRLVALGPQLAEPGKMPA